ncbi:MAG: AGE family epimerase/isomerase [Actinomycetaceae bacterium]|nr:AGE family epimerase/isomerase [Actinomycetaceae bacterium]
MAWFGTIEHERWLSMQLIALLEHGHKAYVPAGFGFIGLDDKVDETAPVPLFRTARSTYVYAMSTLLGIPGSRRRCDHGIYALRHHFRDKEHGGYFSLINPLTEDEVAAKAPGVPALEVEGDRKSSRSHAYVLLAAAAATIANRPGANELMKDAIADELEYFWDDSLGRVRNNWDRSFSSLEPYNGMSANLHSAEAYLALADATGDDEWLKRAMRIIEFVMAQAKINNWRVPEHYDINWNIQKDYNVGSPADPVRPYGINIGHCLQWSRFILETRASLRYRGLPVPNGMLEAAQEIFERARTDAWRKDGKSGFFYTVDYEGKPLVRQRFAWVVLEGILATVALRRTLLDEGASVGEVEHYEHCYRSWLDYCEGYVIREPGKWQMELNPFNEPDDTVWAGYSDVYHAVQTLLAPRLPLAPTMPTALAQELLDKADINAPHKGGSGWSFGRRQHS